MVRKTRRERNRARMQGRRSETFDRYRPAILKELDEPDPMPVVELEPLETDGDEQPHSDDEPRGGA